MGERLPPNVYAASKTEGGRGGGEAKAAGNKAPPKRNKPKNLIIYARERATQQQPSVAAVDRSGGLGSNLRVGPLQHGDAATQRQHPATSATSASKKRRRRRRQRQKQSSGDGGYLCDCGPAPPTATGAALVGLVALHAFTCGGDHRGEGGEQMARR